MASHLKKPYSEFNQPNNAYLSNYQYVTWHKRIGTRKKIYIFICSPQNSTDPLDPWLMWTCFCLEFFPAPTHLSFAQLPILFHVYLPTPEQTSKPVFIELQWLFFCVLFLLSRIYYPFLSNLLLFCHLAFALQFFPLVLGSSSSTSLYYSLFYSL